MIRRLLAGIGISGMLVVPLFANVAPVNSSSEGTALKGTLLSRMGEDGAWVETSVDELAKGTWYQTGADSIGVISYGDGMRLRLAPNTLVRVKSPTEVDLRRGKILARIEPGAGKLSVRSSSAEVLSSGGTFVCSASGKDMALKVVTGRARLKGDEVVTPQLPENFQANGVDLFPGLIAYTEGYTGPEADVAMDGPDTRSRPQQRTSPEQVPPRSAGEDQPPTASPSPEATSPTPTLETPTPGPIEQPTSTPPTSGGEETIGGGGGEIAPIVAGAAVTGGIIAFLLSQQDGEEQNNFVLIPGSP